MLSFDRVSNQIGSSMMSLKNRSKIQTTNQVVFSGDVQTVTKEIKIPQVKISFQNILTFTYTKPFFFNL